MGHGHLSLPPRNEGLYAVRLDSSSILTFRGGMEGKALGHLSKQNYCQRGALLFIQWIRLLVPHMCMSCLIADAFINSVNVPLLKSI